MELSGKLTAKNFYLLILSFFGTGFISKKMPGTVGSIFATLIVLTIFHTPKILLLFSVISFVVGALFCDLYIIKNKYETNRDPSYAVIDEAAGIFFGAYLLTLFLNVTPIAIVVNFCLFRIFDIFKPSPIRNIEMAMKKKDSTVGVGIMFDDILAAVFASTLQIIISKCF